MPRSLNVLPAAPTAITMLSGLTGWPMFAHISPLGCMVGNGSTDMCRMPGISADRVGKDGSKSLGLRVVGALIDIGGHRPIAVRHNSGCVEDDQDIEPIEDG